MAERFWRGLEYVLSKLHRPFDWMAGVVEKARFHCYRRGYPRTGPPWRYHYDRIEVSPQAVAPPRGEEPAD